MDVLLLFLASDGVGTKILWQLAQLAGGGLAAFTVIKVTQGVIKKDVAGLKEWRTDHDKAHTREAKELAKAAKEHEEAHAREAKELAKAAKEHEEAHAREARERAGDHLSLSEDVAEVKAMVKLLVDGKIKN